MAQTVRVITPLLGEAKAGLMAMIRTRRRPRRPDTTSAPDTKEIDHCCPGAPTLLAVGREAVTRGSRSSFPDRWASALPTAFLLRRAADSRGRLIRTNPGREARVNHRDTG